MKGSLRIICVVTGVFLFLMASSAWAELTIGNYTLVSSKRVSRVEYEYTYQAQVTNDGEDAKNVMAQVTSSSPYTTVVDGILEFGDVAAGASATSTDTFTIKHNRSYSLDWSVLAWDVQHGEAVGVIGPEGGVVEVNDANSVLYGASITFPENSGLDNVNAYIKKSNVTKDTERFISVPIDFGPNGDFEQLVKVTIPFITPLDSDKVVSLYYWDKDINSWVSFGNSVIAVSGDTSASFEVNHFTSMAAEADDICTNTGGYIQIGNKTKCSSIVTLNSVNGNIQKLASSRLSLLEVELLEIGNGITKHVALGSYKISDTTNSTNIVMGFHNKTTIEDDIVTDIFQMWKGSVLNKALPTLNEFVDVEPISQKTFFRNMIANGDYEISFNDIVPNQLGTAKIKITSILDNEQDIFPDFLGDKYAVDTGNISLDRPLSIEGNLARNYFSWEKMTLVQDDKDSFVIVPNTSGELFIKVSSTYDVEMSGDFFDQSVIVEGSGDNDAFGTIKEYVFEVTAGDNYILNISVPNEYIENNRYYDINLSLRETIELNYDHASPVSYSQITSAGLSTMLSTDGINGTLGGNYAHRVRVQAGGGYYTHTEMKFCLNVIPIDGYARGTSDDSLITRAQIGVDPNYTSNRDLLLSINGTGWLDASNYLNANEIFMILDSKWGSNIDTYIYFWFSTDTPITDAGYSLLDNYSDDFGGITINSYQIIDN